VLKRVEFGVVNMLNNFAIAAKMRRWNGSTASHVCFSSCRTWCQQPAPTASGKESVR